MSHIGLVYRRIGSFVIDMTIVNIFSTLVSQFLFRLLTAFFSEEGNAISSTNDAWLFIMLGVVLSFFFVMIGVYLIYHWLCYRLLKTSLSRYLLSLKLVSTNEEALTQTRYLEREFKKIYFTVMTLGFYLLYHGAQLIAHNYAPWHDKKYHTQVVSM